MKCDICSQTSEDFLFFVEENEALNPRNFEWLAVFCEDCVEDVFDVEMIDYYAHN